MVLMFASKCEGFTMFLTHLEKITDAIVFDDDVGCLLCTVVEISSDKNVAGDYKAEFTLLDDTFTVGVKVVRSEYYPNELLRWIQNFNGLYC